MPPTQPNPPHRFYFLECLCSTICLPLVFSFPTCFIACSHLVYLIAIWSAIFQHKRQFKLQDKGIRVSYTLLRYYKSSKMRSFAYKSTSRQPLCQLHNWFSFGLCKYIRFQNMLLSSLYSNTFKRKYQKEKRDIE